MILLSVLTLLSVSAVFGKDKMPEFPVDSSTNKISYTDVVSVDSLVKKQELFSKVREWFAKTYNSSTNVIQMEDKENGKIVGKALIQIYKKTAITNYEWGAIHYTISIYIKDGRYKYVITDFYHTGQYTSSGGIGLNIPNYGVCEGMINYKPTFWDPINIKKTLNSMLIQMDSNVNNLIQDLKLFMSKKSFDQNSGNW